VAAHCSLATVVTVPSEQVKAAVALASGGRPARIVPRPPLAHQTNRLHDVWVDRAHLIAKEFVLADERMDGADREFRALRLLQSLDIAPRPLVYDHAVGPVVIYAYMDGAMWDRRVPSTPELVALADVWVQVHDLPTRDLWLGRNQAQPFQEIVQRIRAPIEAYAAWVARAGHAQQTAARLAQCALERFAEAGAELELMERTLCFCRLDTRFANVIGRPDGRLGLIDWEDSGLRDPARELADLFTHPNQEDLLDASARQVFLDQYLPSRRADPGLADRLHRYLPLFSLSWLSLLLAEGMRRAEQGTLDGWLVNEMPPNERLRRYLARCNAWPAFELDAVLADLGDVVFF
jgi:aminoglycoside phosphotransferase (APT) family kinase protein